MFIFSQYLQTWEAHSGLSQKLDINKKSTIFNHEQLCFGRGKGGKGLGKGMGHARHPTTQYSYGSPYYSYGTTHMVHVRTTHTVPVLLIRFRTTQLLIRFLYYSYGSR